MPVFVSDDGSSAIPSFPLPSCRVMIQLVYICMIQVEVECILSICRSMQVHMSKAEVVSESGENGRVAKGQRGRATGMAVTFFRWLGTDLCALL